MSNATLVLSSKLTLIKEVTGGVVIANENMSELSNLVKGITCLKFRGLSKPSKMIKYQSIILALGFKESCIDWNRNAGFDGKNSDVIDFQITYTNGRD